MGDILAIADATAALPEIFLALATMALLMLGVFSKRNPTEMINTLALAVLAVTAGLVVVMSDGETQRAFMDSFVVDGFARFMKMLVLFGSAAAIIMSSSFMKTEKLDQFEYPILIMMATVGMMMMISANDLIALYMGLELQSLSLYVVAAFNRDSARSSEAGLKYFVLGALSSGMLLYGASLIYGFSGSVAFSEIARAAAGDEVG
ncbi:MAG: NADH-quinone oxidoreductase subunit N, partial [Anderseniella sp.]|nr:NADH-quinone oxidoreductase subunit N [Anderseniella sp.]